MALQGRPRPGHRLPLPVLLRTPAAGGERLLSAKEQGQIRDDVDVQLLVDQLWGAVYHRMLVPDEPVTDDFVVALVSNLIDGITP